MKLKTITILALVLLMASCGDEPKPSVDEDNAIQVKMEDDRTVLIGTEDGKVYNMKDGSVYATLPGCIQITDMTMHGEDWYATGQTNGNILTYWVNGSPTTISGTNGDGVINCIARSYDNVYFAARTSYFNYLYKNGTKLAETPGGGEFVDLAAYGDNFYALGNSVGTPEIWTNDGVSSIETHDKYVTATGLDLMVNSQGATWFASGYFNTTQNGMSVTTPCMWRNGSLATLPINFTEKEINNHTYNMGTALDVSHYGSKTYVVGSRTDNSGTHATVWVSSSNDEDDVRTYWQAEGNVDAEATKTLAYGADVYVMTVEHNRDTDSYCTRIWMNHELKGTINGIIGNGFVVI